MKSLNIKEFPSDILPDYTQGAEVIHYTKSRMGGGILHLKTLLHGEIFVKVALGFERLELIRESRNLYALKEYLNVPKVLSFSESDQYAILATSKINGKPLHECLEHLDRRNIVVLISNVLDSLWSAAGELKNTLPIAITEELENVRLLIEEQKINEDDFQKRSGGLEAREAYSRIIKAIESHDTDIISHGDLCLPNIMITSQNDWCLIDWGKGGMGDKYRDISSLAGSLNRNIDTDIFFEIVKSMGIDLQRSGNEKISLYKMIDMFWYSAVL